MSGQRRTVYKHLYEGSSGVSICDQLSKPPKRHFFTMPRYALDTDEIAAPEYVNYRATYKLLTSVQTAVHQTYHLLVMTAPNSRLQPQHPSYIYI